jgi:hypothetical protein
MCSVVSCQIVANRKMQTEVTVVSRYQPTASQEKLGRPIKIHELAIVVLYKYDS